MAAPYSPELHPTLADLIGDASAFDIIDSRLMPAPYEGGRTLKYFVDGLPEVIVRHGPGEPEPSMRDTVATAFKQLPSYGIVSLPYLPVVHNDEVYVFTRKVHGKSLRELASPDAGPTLVRSIDVQWANIIAYFHTARAKGFARAGDIVGLQQHMYGRTIVDPQDRVRLADLGQSAINCAQFPQSGVYELDLIDAANDLINTEIVLDTSLPAARVAIERAMQFAEEVHDGPTYIRAARFVLAEMVTADPNEDDDFFDKFAL